MHFLATFVYILLDNGKADQQQPDVHGRMCCWVAQM